MLANAVLTRYAMRRAENKTSDLTFLVGLDRLFRVDTLVIQHKLEIIQKSEEKG